MLMGHDPAHKMPGISKQLDIFPYRVGSRFQTADLGGWRRVCQPLKHRPSFNMV